MPPGKIKNARCTIDAKVRGALNRELRELNDRTSAN